MPPGSLVEVTCRTVQGRLLLSPDPVVVDLIRGVLARAARLYPVDIHAFCFLSNHFHLLLTVPGADRLAAFMNYLNANLAREVGRHVHWRERFWGRRYQAILVSHEPAAQIERLLYILRHGCKENLVRHPDHWPGASSTDALRTGRPICGTWIDRTAEYRQTRYGRSRHGRTSVTQVESLTLAPLPCWQELPAADYRARCVELIEQVAAETAQRLRALGREVLGRTRLLRQRPHARAERLEKRPAPLVHAATGRVRRHLRRSYREFVDAFRRAAASLRSGQLAATEALLLFPLGAFPPPGPFVRAALSPPG